MVGEEALPGHEEISWERAWYPLSSECIPYEVLASVSTSANLPYSPAVGLLTPLYKG